MNEIYRQAFNAINDGNLTLFKKLVKIPNFIFTTTDHCHEALEAELGGAWAENCGRWENNTFLNLALSLERLDFVEELIRLHQEGYDIGLNVANNALISPLHMLLMVGCDKKGQDVGRCIAQFSRVLPIIWNASSFDIKYAPNEMDSAINKIYHLPALAAMEVLKQCRCDLDNPVYKQSILLAIQEMINGITTENGVQNKLMFIALMKEDVDYRLILDECLIRPRGGRTTPFIFELLNNGYLPIPNLGQLGFVGENEVTRALITSRIYALRRDSNMMDRTRQRTLSQLLSPEFEVVMQVQPALMVPRVAPQDEAVDARQEERGAETSDIATSCSFFRF